MPQYLYNFFSILFLFNLISCTKVLRPRGVSLSKASLYVPDVDFTCFDGSITIPFLYVNDDYCDCEDGSDEPGTSACPNGTFFCTNAGHLSRIIPSSRVNDGICDCCDGSDEYENKVSCLNNCEELGHVAREEARQREELIRQGSEMMLQLSERGKNMKKEKQERLNQLEKEKTEAEALKQEKEKLKNEVETSENIALEKYRLIEEQEKKKQEEDERNKKLQKIFEYFSDIDKDHDGKITVEEVKAYDGFDSNKDGVVTEDEVEYFMAGAESYDWEQFHEVGWSKLKPLIVAHQQQQTDGQEKSELEIDENQDSSQNVDKNELDDENDGSEDEEEEEAESEIDRKVEETEEHKDIVDISTTYDDETKQLIEIANKARSEFEEAERNVRDMEREKRQIEESMNKDYGTNEEFAPLEGECYEYSDHEYVYKFCPFDQVSQRPLSGGVETRLGVWSGWSGPNKYDGMKFDNGQTCWNGPARSAYVSVICGLESAVISASEPNRCEYLLEFITPAACHPELIKHYETREHDEL